MRHRRWAGGMATAAVLIVNSAAASDRSVHEIQLTASRYAFDPVTMQVNAGEPVRVVIRSMDGIHGFSIPKLKIDVQVPNGGNAVTVDFTAPAAGPAIPMATSSTTS